MGRSLHEKRQVSLDGFRRDVARDACTGKERSLELRLEIGRGIDPLELRRQQVAELSEVPSLRFRDAAAQYIAANEAGWRNSKHRSQWSTSLRDYAHPFIGAKDVREINLSDLLAILTPIWSDKTETAKRVRGRIENILDSAKVKGYREGENSARWKGNLSLVLPKPSQVKTIRHHAALPYARIHEFIGSLQALDTVASAALEF